MSRDCRNAGRVVGVLVGLMSLGVWGGCDGVRLGLSEAQKQSRYLHHRTVGAIAVRAREESVSGELLSLSELAMRQSEAIVAYAGFPKELPAAQRVDDLLGEASAAITRQAWKDAMVRVEPWDAAESMLEWGLALAGVIGGVYGAKVVGVLKLARLKSAALREVVQGNEMFKQQHRESKEFFKEAHQHQSAETRQLVAGMRG